MLSSDGRTFPNLNGNPENGSVTFRWIGAGEIFGADYVMGVATALASSGVTVWTPASLYGPRGVIAEGGQWPIVDALACLSKLAGQPVHTATLNQGMARLCVGTSVIKANTTPDENDGLESYGWREKI